MFIVHSHPPQLWHYWQSTVRPHLLWINISFYHIAYFIYTFFSQTMYCLSYSQAKKGCVLNECISSCNRNRCIRLGLGRLCIPWVPRQCTRKSSGANSSNSNCHIHNELLNNRMKSSPCGITYRVDGHVTVLCHRSSTDIFTNLTCESFINSSSPPSKITINRLGNRWTPPPPSTPKYNSIDSLSPQENNNIAHLLDSISKHSSQSLHNAEVFFFVDLCR